MRYQRCRCGACEWFGETRRCDQCSKCKSGPGWSPETHREPEPHDFSRIEKVQTDQGDGTITRCRYCYQTRAEIEKRANREAD